MLLQNPDATHLSSGAGLCHPCSHTIIKTPVCLHDVYTVPARVTMPHARLFFLRRGSKTAKEIKEDKYLEEADCMVPFPGAAASG